jgi:hypothetical protein
MEDSNPDQSHMKLSRLLPWVITLAALVYMFLTYDVRGAFEAVSHLDWSYFFLLLVIGVLAPWVVDSFGFWVVFSRLQPSYKFALSDMLPARAISYFFNIVNYSAAGGAVSLFLQRRKGITLKEAVSCFLFLMFVDVLVVSSVLVVGLLLSSAIPEAMRLILWPLVSGIFIFFLGALIYWNGKFDFFIAARFRDWAIFSAFKNASLLDYAAVFAARLALFIVYLLIEFPLVQLFDINIGLREFLVYFPVLVFISILPISIASLGAPQEATIQLYTPFAGGAQPVFIYTMVKVVIFNLARIILGGFFLWISPKSKSTG